MAESLAHRWGQIIGDGFEMFVRNILTDVAKQHSLYLDFKRPRKARGGQGKVTWQDGYGNKHDLDYVLERGGDEETRGVRAGFIESAWRRYTKHSKNTVQEIEAAIMPVALTFSRHQPFLGAVLAGEFTRNALFQLKSKGFAVLHVPYESILTAFNELGIDASSEDGFAGTTEERFREKIAKWESLQQPQATDRLLAKLHALHQREIADFKQRLDMAITRRVNSIRLTVLRGHSVECCDIESAIAYLSGVVNYVKLANSGRRLKFKFDLTTVRKLTQPSQSAKRQLHFFAVSYDKTHPGQPWERSAENRFDAVNGLESRPLPDSAMPGRRGS